MLWKQTLLKLQLFSDVGQGSMQSIPVICCHPSNVCGKKVFLHPFDPSINGSDPQAGKTPTETKEFGRKPSLKPAASAGRSEPNRSLSVQRGYKGGAEQSSGTAGPRQ